METERIILKMETDKQSEERGFRPIGSLTPTKEQLQRQRDTLKNKLIDSSSASVITGLEKRERTPVNSIGGEHGETTFAVALPGYKLAEMHPVAVDKAIRAQLPPSVVSLINIAEICNREFDVIGYKPLTLTISDADAALRVVNQACMEADYEMILKGLARARAMTKRRTEQADDEEITVAAYADLFSGWPADVTAIVLSRLHKLEGGWWPSADRIEKELAIYGRGRLELRKALIGLIESVP